MAGAALSRVPDVQIDGDGVFKYVLVRVRGAGAPAKDVVRGHGWAEYHGEGSAGPWPSVPGSGRGPGAGGCRGPARLGRRLRRGPRAARSLPAADLFERTAEELAPLGLSCECLGGGRLSHRPQERKIHVYGYSVGFGRADHAVTTEKLKAEYPDYEITWADEGY
ncbi:14 kDa phosphohistidine phosphatase isoform X1 [Passer domesticus]|uniref:14 kDa phosphohistidine phosphatase isoform X1 n=1 Tax=Passer domesticus TaxID=48849 RepID=UPI0030FEC832